MHNHKINIAPLIAFLVLPSVGVASADNQKHPLHGSWISQSEWIEEYELTFYPDGTFHLLITDYEGDEDYEDYEDEEDYEAWEELLAEADSNNNGLLDVEDFEAAQALGDEDLPPTWDDVLQEFGDANGDGVIDQEEYESPRNEDAELAEFMTDVFGEAMVATISITGTWDSSDDQFTLTSVEEVYEFNGLTLVEFYTLMLDGMFDLMVQDSEMNDEEVLSEEEFFLSMFLVFSMDSEGNPVDVLEPESLEELKALVVDQMVSMFVMLADKPAMAGLELETFVFSLDRDEMIATDSDGDTLVFTRVDASSAIEAFSWGQIKALHR